MFSLKSFARPGFTFISPWLLAAATGLLVLIVATFAINNMQREKRVMLNGMLQKGVTMIRVIQSGAKSSSIAERRRGVRIPEPWYAHVQRVINHLAADPDIFFLAVTNRQQEVLAHSLPVTRGSIININIPEISTQANIANRFSYRIVKAKGGERYFEVVHTFIPFQPVNTPITLSGLGLQHWFYGNNANKNNQPLHDKFKNDDQYVIVAVLNMREYDRAIEQLQFQLIMLSLIMLLVGVGGWLSLSTMQGYKVSQKTLAGIQAFTSLLVSKLPVGIIATDKDGRVATWNQVVVRLLCIEAEQAVGKKVKEVLPGILADFFHDFKKTDTIFCPESDGQEIQIDACGKAVSLNCFHLVITNSKGEPEGEVLLLSNMTALKNMEKKMREQERLAAVGRMAAGVAHEVRNPLSSVKGLALLLQGKFSEKSAEREAATMLIREVERMNRTISELLSFSRPAPLETTKVDLAKLIERQVRLLKADTASDAVRFHLEIDTDLLPVAADADRLNQVIFNIILNGVQAMGYGGEMIITACNDYDSNMVVVTVTDTGVGMDEETMAQIFFPYFTTKKDGTGIGLAISQKIIAEHEGTIQVKSTLGYGTVITVALPVYALGAEKIG